MKVTLIVPKQSDVKIVDIMASSFFGGLHESGVQIKWYTKKFLHAKVLLVDDEYFSFGSTNIDHRSLGYMYELNIFGNDKRLKEIVKKHIEETLQDTETFNYSTWKKRSMHKKILEILLGPLKTFM